MKTSYFAKSGKNKNNVSIAQGEPKWYTGREYKKLAPGWKLVKAGYNRHKFEKEYRKQVLNKLDPHKVYEELGEDAILLCWEKPIDYCHREIVADWLEENIPGLEIKELGFEDKITRKSKLEEKGFIKPGDEKNIKLINKIYQISLF